MRREVGIIEIAWTSPQVTAGNADALVRSALVERIESFDREVKSGRGRPRSAPYMLYSARNSYFIEWCQKPDREGGPASSPCPCLRAGF